MAHCPCPEELGDFQLKKKLSFNMLLPDEPLGALQLEHNILGAQKNIRCIQIGIDGQIFSEERKSIETLLLG